MKQIHKIIADKIKSVSTRFFYKQKKLCFQILLIYGEEKLILSREFENYQEYQVSHDYLVNGINDHQELSLDFFSSLNGQQLVFSA